MKKPTFWNVFIFILLCTFVGFGGGNALLPIIRKYSVEKYKWIDEEEFKKLVVLVNILPGPSVLEAFSYIAIKLLGKWKGMLVTIIGVMPSLAFFWGIFIALQFIPKKEYLFAINVGVLTSISAIVFAFGTNYLKSSIKELSPALWISIFFSTLLFLLFTPAPLNIASLPIILIIIVIFITDFYKRIKNKKLANIEKTDISKGVDNDK